MRVGDDQDTELGELLEDTAASTDDYIKQASLQADLEQLMADLTLQQRQILSLRFGLEDGQPLSLAKIGARLGVSRVSRVRQIEQVNKLRRHKANIASFV